MLSDEQLRGDFREWRNSVVSKEFETDESFELTIVPGKLAANGLPIKLKTTIYKTPTGYHYTTGFWHAWITGSPGDWVLHIQEKIQNDDFKTATKWATSKERARLEWKMAEILHRWNQG